MPVEKMSSTSIKQAGKNGGVVPRELKTFTRRTSRSDVIDASVAGC
jgi:hypothetical protein